MRLARHVGGALPVDAFARRWTGAPGGAVASSAQWRTGCRVDLPALSRLCREGGAFLVVDAIQELGALRADVRQTPIDLLVAGGHEWLSAPLGCGLLHVSRQAQASLRETSLGYLSLEEPQGG